MIGYLLDTNVLSEAVRPEPNPAVMAWVGALPTSEAFLSAATVAEIRYGTERLPSGHRRTQLLKWIAIEIPSRFGVRILPVDEGIAQRWGQLKSMGEARGLHRDDVDCCIAATAEIHKLTVVTRNVRHFAHDPVNVINPWEIAL